MSTQPPTPRLTPQFCLTPTALSSFLSRSRALTDDTISQNLSALSTPSKNPFAISPTGRLPSTSRLPNSACGSFIAGSLLPAWAARDKVLEYCDHIAQGNGGDGDSGEGAQNEAEAWARVKGMRDRADQKYETAISRRARRPVMDSNEPDERLDPYSARREEPETRRELLVRVLRREREVEEIVRHRSWGVVRDRCTGVEGGWQEVMGSWAHTQKPS